MAQCMRQPRLFPRVTASSNQAGMRRLVGAQDPSKRVLLGHLRWPGKLSSEHAPGPIWASPIEGHLCGHRLPWVILWGACVCSSETCVA